VVRFPPGATRISVLQIVQLALEAVGHEVIRKTKRCYGDIGAPALCFGGIGFKSELSLRFFVLFLYP
jgi:hypothetical protein